MDLQNFTMKIGKLQAEGTYKNGEVDGVATTYDENGKILQQVTYKNGKEVKISKKSYC